MKKAVFLIVFSLSSFANSAVTSTGYGNSKEKALENAFSNAISQYVGVVIDSKTVLKNNKLIEREILSFSNGYIENYNVLSSKKKATLWEVSIRAKINKQGLFSKIKKLKIKNKAIENSDEVYATLSSKIKTKYDAEKLLKKVFKSSTSQETIESLISFNVNGMDIDMDSATRSTVPVTVTYSVYFNRGAYYKIANNFSTLFLKLGAKLQNVYKIDEEEYLVDPTFDLGNNIFIIKESSRDGFYAYQYQFPNSYKMIYPFKMRSWDLLGKYKYKLSFIDNKNNLTFSKEYEYNNKFFEYVRNKTMFSWRKSYLHYQGSSLAIRPVTLKISNELVMYLYTKTEHYDIPIKAIENLKQIKISWISE